MQKNVSSIARMTITQLRSISPFKKKEMYFYNIKIENIEKLNMNFYKK
jgi:hypothetical protein